MIKCNSIFIRGQDISLLQDILAVVSVLGKDLLDESFIYMEICKELRYNFDVGCDKQSKIIMKEV